MPIQLHTKIYYIQKKFKHLKNQQHNNAKSMKFS
jgi:hypothetical protein